MKALHTVGIAGVVLASTLAAQEPPKKVKPAKAVRAIRLVGGGAGKALTQEELIARRDTKLGEEWVKNAEWITDFDEARAVARKSKKKIFAYFTRSYAP